MFKNFYVSSDGDDDSIRNRNIEKNKFKLIAVFKIKVYKVSYLTNTDAPSYRKQNSAIIQFSIIRFLLSLHHAKKNCRQSKKICTQNKTFATLTCCFYIHIHVNTKLIIHIMYVLGLLFCRKIKKKKIIIHSRFQ